jgi:hypothetical protein
MFFQKIQDDRNRNNTVDRTRDDDAGDAIGMYPNLAQRHNDPVRIWMTPAAAAFKLGV